MESATSSAATPGTLVPPAVTSLRASMMERTPSEDIREEREELQKAVEQTLNVIMDLDLGGNIRWVSPSWVDVIGTTTESVQGTPIADLIASENKSVFADAVEQMKKDDSRSQFIRFALKIDALSRLFPLETVDELTEGKPRTAAVDLEAQGIMVYDVASGGESHTMWMMRPWVAPRAIKIDLPDMMVDSLGSGAEVLASYLTQLAEAGLDDPSHVSPPAPVLCRICERQISPWWFEKHTDLCAQEHRAEMDVQMAQESLTEHRHAIVRVLDAFEAGRSRSFTGETLPVPEYKGLLIGPSNNSSPGTSSPIAGGATPGRSRERSSGMGHARGRSFAIRRPQARIVELVMDLCDTALEINTPAIKESSQTPGGFRAQSPQSESRISQVLQWETPGTNTLEQEQGLAMLVQDTERMAKDKVMAVLRHRRIIEYAERIRVEFAILVQECIDEAMRKAADIAAGRLSESSTEEETEMPEEKSAASEVARSDVAPASPTASFDPSSSLTAALQRVDITDDVDRRRFSVVGSTRSSSPKECPTPRSYRGLAGLNASRDSRRESVMFESDAGDSDGSIRSSSVASRSHPRATSPMAEVCHLRRQASSRQHQRRSLILSGTGSPRRQESPSRSTQPSSPLRTHRPRNLFPSDGLMSPEGSPMLAHGDSPNPTYHHRRQSSAAVSMSTGEAYRGPPSPRLGGGVVGAPQARAVPPSIKDFEIIKPISKGAFGSVYLSKKKSTGEYFAIKVLKKADMVAKNQVTNVKAERAIMMWQGESDFVAKLYWTFSSKDYLYLVMEYLNGGDCASLIKVLGGLPEDWVKKYLGEVVLGVEHLHSRGIVHRDLKPDNLLIDQKGHLKLTDFGLSRMGLVGRQKRALNSAGADQVPDLLRHGPFARSASMASSRSTSLDLHGRNNSPGSTPQMTPNDAGPSQPSYFSLGATSEPRRVASRPRSDSNGSESLTHLLGHFSLNDHHSLTVQSPTDHSEGESPDNFPLSHTSTHNSLDGKGPSSMPPPNWALFDPEDTTRRFVGTPDYLAPETIRGEPQDETSDWWSVGCIMYEFLYGVPPFHAGQPEQVFEKILARRIHWPEEGEVEVSPEAKDLINKLLCSDPRERLGANKDEKYMSGGEEIRHHAWFDGVNWETLLQDDAQFVPQPENLEDTEYFDPRGATLQSFAEEVEESSGSDMYPERPHDALSRVRSHVNSVKRGLMPLHIPPHVRDLKSRRLSEPVAADDFGNFAYKNLPVLERANKDVIQKLRAEALAKQQQQQQQVVSPGSGVTSPGPVDGSPMLSMPVQRTLSTAKQRPQSPSGLSHTNSSPSRISQPSSPLLVSFVAGQPEVRRKASSNSSSLSQPGAALSEVPRVPPSLPKAATAVASSPVKGRGVPPPLPLSPNKCTPRHGSGTRSRSLTVGSQEGSPVTIESMASHKNRRSQVFDMSPSSSDNEGDKAGKLLKVQRRRQGSRRMSHVMLEGPVYRPLDVLVCEDHPVSRMVMEKLLEKLRCRTISASTGSEAVRFAMSDIKFDMILMEFKLPHIGGADVARMIRETKNTNAHTPLVAITAYIKELQAPHYFDSLIEKPISSSKLTEVLGSLCQWKPSSPSLGHVPPGVLGLPHPVPSGLRQETLRLEDSPTSGSSGYANRSSSSFREDSITSSLYGDSESVSTDDVPMAVGRQGEWDVGASETGGLGISTEETHDLQRRRSSPLAGVAQSIAQPPAPAHADLALQTHHGTHSPTGLAPRRAKREASFEKRRDAAGTVDSADDEDDDVHGGVARQHYRCKSSLPSSKLGIEMMRANSHDSVTVTGGVGELADKAGFPPPMAQPLPAITVFGGDGDGDAQRWTRGDMQEVAEEDDCEEGDQTVLVTTPPHMYEGEEVEETPRPGPVRTPAAPPTEMEKPERTMSSGAP